MNLIEQAVSEQMEREAWLTYLNDYLYEHGCISYERYLCIAEKILEPPETQDEVE